MAIGYSGSFYQFGNRAKEAGNGVVVDWRLPKEGAPIWFDTFAIPKIAKNVEEAHEFLSTLLDPKVNAPICDFVGYPNANKDSLALINKDITGKGRVLWISLAASTVVLTPLDWWFQGAAPD